MKKNKNTSGQALFETVVILFVLVGMIFAAMQLSIIAYGVIVAQISTQSAIRSVVVQKNGAVSALLVFRTQLGQNNILPPNVETVQINPQNCNRKDNSGADISGKEIKLTYIQKIMFSSFLNPFGIPGVLKNSISSRMINSPDVEYYHKAYKGAPEW